MAKYRKKPVVIDAVQFTGDNYMEISGFMNKTVTIPPGSKAIIINTLEGDMTASPGDYIIRGINGEYYPCKPDIFEKTTYEKVNENPSPCVSCRQDMASCCGCSKYYAWESLNQ